MNPHNPQSLQKAFELFAHQQNALLPDEETLSSITLSDNFKQRMQKLLRRQRRGFFVLFGTAGRRIASIAVAVLVATTVTTFSVEALREPVFQFFAEVYEKFTQVFFVDDTPDVPEIQFEKKTPAYIPEGYVVESEIDTPTVYKIVYINNQGKKLRYAQKLKESIEIQADTEDIQYNEVMIDNYRGVAYSNKGSNYVVFSDDIYTYTFSGDISINELIKHAKTIV